VRRTTAKPRRSAWSVEHAVRHAGGSHHANAPDVSNSVCRTIPKPAYRTTKSLPQNHSRGRKGGKQRERAVLAGYCSICIMLWQSPFPAQEPEVKLQAGNNSLWQSPPKTPQGPNQTALSRNYRAAWPRPKLRRPLKGTPFLRPKSALGEGTARGRPPSSVDPFPVRPLRASPGRGPQGRSPLPFVDPQDEAHSRALSQNGYGHTHTHTHTHTLYVEGRIQILCHPSPQRHRTQSTTQRNGHSHPLRDRVRRKVRGGKGGERTAT
jgi:hypothetical protein